MGRKYLIHDQDAFYFLTFTVVNWIDIFTRNVYREIFVESVKHCQQKKGLDVYAWCIMTNHIHTIFGSGGIMKLEDIIRDLKSFTSRHIRKELEQNSSESRSKWIMNLLNSAGLNNKRNKDFQLWQQHNHPIELSTNEMIDQRLNYTHYNPVAAGFIEKPEDWLWSSARDYYGTGKGMIELKFIE